jgi:hypothetical protein
LRHSFVSLLSDDGVPLSDIADLCGHAGTSVTEKIYRHQLRPVLLKGAVAMDRIFPASNGRAPNRCGRRRRRRRQVKSRDFTDAGADRHHLASGT